MMSGLMRLGTKDAHSSDMNLDAAQTAATWDLPGSRDQ